MYLKANSGVFSSFFTQRHVMWITLGLWLPNPPDPQLYPQCGRE